MIRLIIAWFHVFSIDNYQYCQLLFVLGEFLSISILLGMNCIFEAADREMLQYGHLIC